MFLGASAISPSLPACQRGRPRQRPGGRPEAVGASRGRWRVGSGSEVAGGDVPGPRSSSTVKGTMLAPSLLVKAPRRTHGCTRMRNDVVGSWTMSVSSCELRCGRHWLARCESRSRVQHWLKWRSCHAPWHRECGMIANRRCNRENWRGYGRGKSAPLRDGNACQTAGRSIIARLVHGSLALP